MNKKDRSNFAKSFGLIWMHVVNKFNRYAEQVCGMLQLFLWSHNIVSHAYMINLLKYQEQQMFMIDRKYVRVCVCVWVGVCNI